MRMVSTGFGNLYARKDEWFRGEKGQKYVKSNWKLRKPRRYVDYFLGEF